MHLFSLSLSLNLFSCEYSGVCSRLVLPALDHGRNECSFECECVFHLFMWKSKMRMNVNENRRKFTPRKSFERSFAKKKSSLQVHTHTRTREMSEKRGKGNALTSYMHTDRGYINRTQHQHKMTTKSNTNTNISSSNNGIRDLAYITISMDSVLKSTSANRIKMHICLCAIIQWLPLHPWSFPLCHCRCRSFSTLGFCRHHHCCCCCFFTLPSNRLLFVLFFFHRANIFFPVQCCWHLNVGSVSLLKCMVPKLSCVYESHLVCFEWHCLWCVLISNPLQMLLT